MAIIEGFRVRNFRSLKDVTLGKLWQLQGAEPLTPLTVVIGKNGVGKSTLFDAFGFIADCLRVGVEDACFSRERGGFDKLLSQEQNGSIEFEIYFREDMKSRPITYELSIRKDESGKVIVERERLRQRRSTQTHGRPYSFLILNEGKGVAWKGNDPGLKIDEDASFVRVEDLFSGLGKGKVETEGADYEEVELDDKSRLGIATIGSLKQHPRISAFRRFIEGWYLSYFSPNAARELPKAGPQKHLNVVGDNLANVVQYLENRSDGTLQEILRRVAEKIPGIGQIKTHKDDYSNNLYLLFTEKGFSVPFTHMQMSDGTLKVFAYLLMLEDPDPPPFLCIEEPENGLYHKLLETLAYEFRQHAMEKRGRRSQVFVTTHQPYFVDALEPKEVWILEKGSDGFSSVRRASDDAIVRSMFEEGQPLGSLWYSDYLDPR